MNWITVAVVGAVAAWFEYSYRRSRRKRAGNENEPSTTPVTQPARVASPGSEPSIVPGDENDKQMNAAV
ncbi:MAG: hypothetical protein WAM71_02295 [Candidatus Korobacteraceae bacterium]